MGHHISAIVCKPSIAVDRIVEFDLPVLRSGEFVIIPMNPYHIDDWVERLGLGHVEAKSNVILDSRFTHYIAAIAADGDYAHIETDYFGGVGDQVAAVYRQNVEIPIFTSPRRPGGVINEALRLIGVRSVNGFDEFTILGLAQHRDFDDYFEQYYA